MRELWYEMKRAHRERKQPLCVTVKSLLLEGGRPKIIGAALTIVLTAAMLLPLCGFAPDAAQAPSADVIVTATPTYDSLAELRGAERFPQGAQLLRIHAGKPEPLVSGFVATADANVSFDAKSVLFAGKKTASDPWQIWELTLADNSLRRLVAGSSDAIRPFYLPAGRLVYAQHTEHGFQLTSAGKDSPNALAPLENAVGATLLPLAYLPSSTIPINVLADGRILFEAGYPLGTGDTPELFLVYSDGSGVESYRCDHGSARWGGKQLESGDVIFTHGKTLARFTSPLATEASVNAPRAQYAGAIAETDKNIWLVSARAAEDTHYALKLWKPGTAVLQTYLSVNGENLVDPVVVAPRTRPKHHPSGLHDWSYANILALDARLSREGDLRVTPASVRLETMDANGNVTVTGMAPVEADGSFFVKTPADRPIRFALLDEKGAVLRQEHGWFWIRRGEQRICVGCHVGPERASENRVPAVLMRTTIPFDLTGASVKPGTPGGK